MDRIQKTDRCPLCRAQFQSGDAVIYQLRTGPNGLEPRPVHLDDLVRGLSEEHKTPEPPPPPPASKDPALSDAPPKPWWPFGRRD